MTTESNPTRDEMLRRVGRNLLLFQQIELLFKFLLTNYKVSGTAETYQANQQKQADCISTKMLGLLVDKYGNEFLKDAGADVPEDEGPPGWFSFTFRLSANADFIASLRRDMKMMTDERNDLVHHFLSRQQPNSPEQMAQALIHLDVQREKVLPIYEHLKTTVSHMQEGRRRHAEFLASPEFEKQSELMWLQASPLVGLLSDFATQCPRIDGWADLSQAGRVAAKEAPEEVNSLAEFYGFKTLKTLLVGSEVFDVYDEPLPNGQFRTLYRNRAAS